MESDWGKAIKSPYVCSANELPTVKELRYQIALLKPFGLISRGLKGIRQIKEIENELNGLVLVVDRFYSLLGEKGWVFSEVLSVERIRLIVEKSADSSSAEDDFISYLKEGEAINFALNRCNRYEDMRPRLPLLRRAAEDYFEGRYYSAVLVLIAVMDGFVNDSDKAVRRGLHTRNPEEMHTEDCVATMWTGLPAVQSTFTKSFHAREDSEVHSVFRHGIMHGMVTNFDNVIVASKAWCMLFAICDWVDSIELDKKRRQEQEGQKSVSLRSVLKKYIESKRKLADDEEYLAQWKPHFVDLSNPLAEDKELLNACVGYFDYWQKRNYGKLAGYLADPAEKSKGAMAGEARAAYSAFPIDQYRIESIERTAAAVAEVHVSLESEKGKWSPHIRFVRTGEDGVPRCDWEQGEWRIVGWAVDPFLDAED